MKRAHECPGRHTLLCVANQIKSPASHHMGGGGGGGGGGRGVQVLTRRRGLPHRRVGRFVSHGHRPSAHHAWGARVLQVVKTWTRRRLHIVVVGRIGRWHRGSPPCSLATTDTRAGPFKNQYPPLCAPDPHASRFCPPARTHPATRATRAHASPRLQFCKCTSAFSKREGVRGGHRWVGRTRRSLARWGSPVLPFGPGFLVLSWAAPGRLRHGWD